MGHQWPPYSMSLDRLRDGYLLQTRKESKVSHRLGKMMSFAYYDLWFYYDFIELHIYITSSSIVIVFNNQL